MYYEIHVTFRDVQPLAFSGWSSSKIDGDPVLGTGTRWYMTCHTKTEVNARAAVEEAKRFWPQAVRYKIEHVILDERRP